MKPPEIAIPVTFDIQGVIEGVTVKPGETLVLSFKRRLNMQESEEIVSRLKAILEGVSILLVDDDVHLTVLRNNESTDNEELRDMVSEMMIDKFRQLARVNGGIS